MMMRGFCEGTEASTGYTDTAGMTIQITRKKDEPGATTLGVEASLDVVRAAERRAARDFARKTRIPGFRKGKAPPEVIRRRFGAALRESVLREIIADSWKQALDLEGLEPLSEPRVLELTFEEDRPVTFDLLVEVKPELTLARTGGFTVTRRIERVTDAMVDEQLESLRRQRAPWVPLEERPTTGDLVRVTISTTSEGNTTEGKPYEIVLGTEQAIPDVEDRIMTLTPGESIDATVRFPDDFADESKRGQLVSTHITLHEAKRQALPELTDDFAREVGDFTGVEELRAAVRSDLETSAIREADAQVRRDLIEQLVAANNVPAPRPMVERGLRSYANAYQIPDTDLEQFAREFGPVVESQVRRELVIEALAQAQRLEATEDDIDERIEAIAARRGTEPGKVYAALQKEGGLKELERTILEEKVFAWILDQSTITDAD